MANQQSAGRSGNFPLDNLSYDIITVLYEKSKALEAFDKYLKDAQGDSTVRQLFEQMRDQDEQFIQQLQQHLSRLLGGGATTGTGSSKGAVASDTSRGKR